MNKKEKKTQGHRQQCGEYSGEGHIRGLSGNGKKYNKNFEKKMMKCKKLPQNMWYKFWNLVKDVLLKEEP